MGFYPYSMNLLSKMAGTCPDPFLGVKTFVAGKDFNRSACFISFTISLFVLVASGGLL